MSDDKKEFTRNQLTSIIHKRVNKLNARIYELETEIAILEMEAEQHERKDDTIRTTHKRFSRR